MAKSFYNLTQTLKVGYGTFSYNTVTMNLTASAILLTLVSVKPSSKF